MRKHSNICPECGAWLDPGERCDCQDAAKELAQTLKGLSTGELLRLNALAKVVTADRQTRPRAVKML